MRALVHGLPQVVLMHLGHLYSQIDYQAYCFIFDSMFHELISCSYILVSALEGLTWGICRAAARTTV